MLSAHQHPYASVRELYSPKQLCYTSPHHDKLTTQKPAGTPSTWQRHPAADNSSMHYRNRHQVPRSIRARLYPKIDVDVKLLPGTNTNPPASLNPQHAQIITHSLPKTKRRNHLNLEKQIRQVTSPRPTWPPDQSESGKVDSLNSSRQPEFRD